VLKGMIAKNCLLTTWIRLQVESDELAAGFESSEQRSNNMHNDKKAKRIFCLKNL
jgi:hypothetical protein